MSFKGAIEQVYMLPAWISSDIQMFSSIISVSQFDSYKSNWNIQI